MVNLVSKSGTNAFRGGFSVYWSPEALQEAQAQLDLAQARLRLAQIRPLAEEEEASASGVAVARAQLDLARTGPRAEDVTVVAQGKLNDRQVGAAPGAEERGIADDQSHPPAVPLHEQSGGQTDDTAPDYRAGAGGGRRARCVRFPAARKSGRFPGK